MKKWLLVFNLLLTGCNQNKLPKEVEIALPLVREKLERYIASPIFSSDYEIKNIKMEYWYHYYGENGVLWVVVKYAFDYCKSNYCRIYESSYEVRFWFDIKEVRYG